MSRSATPTQPPVPEVSRAQARYLAKAISLEETGVPHMVRLTLLTVSAMIGVAIGWAAITKVDESALAMGEVVPTGRVQTVQHLEGGIVSEIFIEEGQLVESGQVLLRMDPAAIRAELGHLENREKSLLNQEQIVEEILSMHRRLLEKQYTSRARFLEARRELARTKGELAEVREEMVQLQDRITRTEITAPTRGYVKGLNLNTVGAVVGPGQLLMEIVPADQDLIVEARISTRDIGHVRLGQEAKIKVDTYDFARYGSVPGRLSQISATTFQDEDGAPYYKGRIVLDQHHVGKNPRHNPVLAGMTVQAEIVTGDKSILEYLLKPIRSSVDSAFHER
ncbi:MAG: HlyD family type I secretion periplasmic adaptor subunit [Alphaproteobacteria bacterium]|nr:HlyD family type I secretion periplasmic adaptor subunit [Alphaproteobacteria bacterium]